MLPIFLAFALLTQVTTTQLQPVESPVATLGEAHFSLTDRYSNTYVSTVFADNILLTLAYMRGIVQNTGVDWQSVRQPFTYTFTLKPGKVFAFHESTLPQFAGKVTKTTHAHFDSTQGFESDGYLVADGVCHLASLMNKAATLAGLTVLAPTNHNFAVIPEVDKKYGTAIYYMPGENTTSELQNLYITNNKETPVTFVFTYKDSTLDIAVDEKK